MTIAADYYDCRESERLTHESPEEAVAEWVDLWLTPGCDVSAAIKEHAPVVLQGFRRQELSDAWVRRVAEHLLESAAEMFSEEYGNPDGGDDGLDEAATAEVMPDMMAALAKFYGHAKVWHCDKVEERTLDAEAIEAMMREHHPEWWDEARP